MRKSERLRQLEIAVIRMEMTIELLQITLNNILEAEGMRSTPSLEHGKWYRENSKDS